MVRIALSVLLLAGCGGSDSEDRTTELRAQALSSAQHTCESRGGLRAVTGEFYSHSRTGYLLDVGLVCQCHDGMVFHTPVRRE